MSGDPAERAYKARALAQAHPLTTIGRRLRDRAVAQEERDQPVAEIARWAGEALLKGYCLRKVEEDAADVAPVTSGVDSVTDVDDAHLEALEARAAEIAADLRTGDPAPHLLGDADLTFSALDRIISSELSTRADNAREAAGAGGWPLFEEYIAYWAVRGYALRAAEVREGAQT